ncbi:MAG: phage holin family protein [Acidimicrobiales bacterium]
MAEHRDPPPSAADLASELAQQVTTLVHEELALARAELRETGRRAALGAGLLSGAAACGACAASLSVVLADRVLSSLVGRTASASLLAAGSAASAAVLARAGLARLEELRREPPRRTARSLQEDARWATTLTSSNDA